MVGITARGRYEGQAKSELTLNGYRTYGSVTVFLLPVADNNRTSQACVGV